MIKNKFILAFADDGTLHIYDSEVKAIQEWEGVDVENKVVTFYNSEGIYLKPTFTKENRYGKTLGFLPWSESGAYTLTPNPTIKDTPISVALEGVTQLEPNPWFKNIEEVKSLIA
jgi:hypothetical protein